MHTSQEEARRATQQTGRFHQPGLTLMEMLGALAVIAILIGLSVPIVQRTRAKARIAAAKAGIAAIESALRLYELDHGVKPVPAGTPLLKDQDAMHVMVSGAGISPSTKEPYLQVPSRWTVPGTGAYKDAWDGPFWIRPTPVHNVGGFDVFSAGPDKIKDNGDDVTNWSR